MIENEKQRETTEFQLERLEAALEQSRAQLPANDTVLFQAMIAALESQLEDLRSELTDYKTRQDAPTLVGVGALADVPQALVRARVERNISLDELSQRLSISPTELAAYETSGYRTARFEDVLRIARALRVEIRSHPVSN